RGTDHFPLSSSPSAVASSPPMQPRNHARRFEGILKMKSQAFEAPDPESLQSKSPFARKIESPIKALRVLRGRLIRGGIDPSRPLLASMEPVGPFEIPARF